MCNCLQALWRPKLANKKSAIKRNRQNEKRKQHNRVFRGQARTFIKNARMAMEAGNLEEARVATDSAISALDKAAEKNILHKNNASRRKGRLMKQFAKFEQANS